MMGNYHVRLGRRRGWYELASYFHSIEISKILFDKAADYWKEAIRLAPTNYISAQNWLMRTHRY